MPDVVVPAADRIHWRNEWLDSWQSFPVAGNFDLAANAHGLLLVHNDDTVDAGEGFDSHQHADVEIVTWVLDGSLVHRDSLGNEGTITPGLAQRMSAGSGVVHSERNGAGYSAGTPLRVVQMWLPPDENGRPPGYEEYAAAGELASGRLVTVESGLDRDRGGTAVGLGQSKAALHVARLRPGTPVTLPTAPFLHLFVARGTVEIDGIGTLGHGDALRGTDTGGHVVHTTSSAEILVWEMHAHA
ncbi:pirin family protein [Rhodococcus sp. BP-332]|uniref:pirin family protein n=1 Tax=Rhodococcus sp. BP-332 TaxID=2739447 RepID=UPI001C9A6969|nr:pirin family protein [Rhodococcus sp. BP-332]MBY6677694.1 pirin family protein [Rhodococcus sp. BP-332]